MKNFLIIIIIAIFASCKVTYNNKIQYRDISQSPVSYDVTRLVNGNPTPVYDSIYVVSPTWSQAYKKSSDKAFVWGGGIVGIGSIIGAAIAGTTGVAPFVMVGGVAISGSDLEWHKWNSDKEITKQEYDSLMKTDGDLHAFWNAKSTNFVYSLKK